MGNMVDASGLAIGRWFPKLGRSLRRLSLTRLPTPVTEHALPTVGPIWVKRDDQSGVAYGGNKPRKLEFLLADVLARRRRSVLTFGGLGTHHGLATAIAARSLGLSTDLVLVPQPITDAVRRTLLVQHAVGARLHYAPSLAHAVATGVRLVATGALGGAAPAIVPTGGTSSRGAIGYVNAGLELAEQVVNGELPEPATIVVPLGSGGTLAGLALGVALAGLRSRVIGVLVTDILPPGGRRLAALAGRTLRRLRALDRAVPRVRIDATMFPIVRDQLGSGYGAATPAATAALAAARDLGLGLETTYSAKAFAAVLGAGAGQGPIEAPILFWHTYSAVDPGATLARWPTPAELPPPFDRLAAPG